MCPTHMLKSFLKNNKLKIMSQGSNVSMGYVEKSSAKAGTELILQVEIIKTPRIELLSA